MFCILLRIYKLAYNLQGVCKKVPVLCCFHFLTFFIDVPFQPQFIQLCKTLYDMFLNESNEQQLYHAIATVATLLLQIGDVGKRFSFNNLTSSRSASVAECWNEVEILDEGSNRNSLTSVDPCEDQDRVIGTSDVEGTRRSVQEGSASREIVYEENPKVDLDWSISFEQFLASMLTESELVAYFDSQFDLSPAVDRFRNRRLHRSSVSLSADASSL